MTYIDDDGSSKPLTGPVMTRYRQALCLAILAASKLQHGESLTVEEQARLDDRAQREAAGAVTPEQLWESYRERPFAAEPTHGTIVLEL